MFDTNYKLEALEYLLDEECLIERYHPLIEYKKDLINRSKKIGYKTRNNLEKLSDDELLDFGLKDMDAVKLLRRFLKLYDPNIEKFKEIKKLNVDTKMKATFEQLYYLPGVKQTRASLYYYAGYRTLKDIANSNENEIIEKVSKAISKYNLSYIVPLKKEIRTHIAVAKAFTLD